MSLRATFTTFALTSIFAALAACGGTGGTGGSGGTTTTTGTGTGTGTETASGSGGATSTGSTTTTESGTGGATTTTTASGGGGGGGEAPACTDYVVPPVVLPMVKVRVVNKTSANVFLGQPQVTCAVDLGFTIEDASGTKLKAARDLCDFTCEELQQGGCACPPYCPAPTVTLIAPGGHFDNAWPRTVFESATMPPPCYKESSCGASTCWMESAPPPGPLTIRVSAWTQDVCPGQPTCTQCAPDLTGSCVVSGAQTVAGTEYKASFSWTSQDLVQIDIQ